MPGWIDMHVHRGETSPTEYIDEFTLNDADILMLLVLLKLH
jgi:hypothetical protein